MDSRQKQVLKEPNSEVKNGDKIDEDIKPRRRVSFSNRTLVREFQPMEESYNESINSDSNLTNKSFCLSPKASKQTKAIKVSDCSDLFYADDTIMKAADDSVFNTMMFLSQIDSSLSDTSVNLSDNTTARAASKATNQSSSHSTTQPTSKMTNKPPSKTINNTLLQTPKQPPSQTFIKSLPHNTNHPPSDTTNKPPSYTTIKPSIKDSDISDNLSFNTASINCPPNPVSMEMDHNMTPQPHNNATTKNGKLLPKKQHNTETTTNENIIATKQQLHNTETTTNENIIATKQHNTETTTNDNIIATKQHNTEATTNESLIDSSLLNATPTCLSNHLTTTEAFKDSSVMSHLKELSFMKESSYIREIHESTHTVESNEYIKELKSLLRNVGVKKVFEYDAKEEVVVGDGDEEVEAIKEISKRRLYWKPGAKGSKKITQHKTYSTNGHVLMMKNDHSQVPDGFVPYDFMKEAHARLQEMKPVYVKKTPSKPPIDHQWFKNFDVQEFLKDDASKVLDSGVDNASLNGTSDTSDLASPSTLSDEQVQELLDKVKIMFPDITSDDDD